MTTPENPFGIVELPRGHQLTNPVVQFDTVKGSGPAVISHAHGDHTAEDPTCRVIATPATAALLRVRRHSGPIVELPYDTWRQEEGFRMKLLPAGHILGSAQILIEREDGLRLLYTGDMKIRQGWTCESARFEEVDDLIIESTFGLPIFRFPPEEEVAASMVEWVRTCFDQRLIPVFLAYLLGKGQEIMRILAEAEIPMLVHGSMLDLNQVYHDRGCDLGDYKRYDPAYNDERRAWVIPPFSREAITGRLSRARICYASGWALIESRRESVRASLMAPLSDHADYYDLMTVIERTRPSRVWAVHGPYADLFARDVARRFAIQAG